MTTATLDPVDHRPVRALRAGARLVPGYLAWRPLGVGHRAETWLAWSTELFSPVVVKLPRPDQLRHPRARAALDREATALTRVTHPALPRLLDDRRHGSVPHLVLEWLDGPPLDDLLAEHGPRPEHEVLALAAALAAVLRLLHARGIAHLDLTPANVVVRDGWPTLVDLGAARPLGSDPGGAGVVGTPGFAAPELERGESVAASMDLYGLGAVLRDALGGAGPEHGLLGEVVATLLAPDPRERPRDVDDLLGRLAAAAGPIGGPPWPRFAERARGRLDRPG